MSGRGLVQVYTGDGKGKTSAAMGAALRAVGQGFRVCVVQFLKGGAPSAETEALEALKGQVEVFRFGRKPGAGQDSAWVDPANPLPEDRDQCLAALEHSKKAMNSGRYDLVVLDEVNLACAWGLVPEDDLLRLIRERPEKVELILTGRSAPPALVAQADLVTEMLNIKHPFERGVRARKGVER